MTGRAWDFARELRQWGPGEPGDVSPPETAPRTPGDSRPPARLCAARAYCASDWQIFTTVAIPGAVPFILTGVRQAVALGLIGVVVGEMFGGSEGIGYMVNYGGQTFQTDAVFLGVVIIAAAGIILSWVTGRLEQHFSRWRPER